MKEYAHCLQNEEVVFNNVLRALRNQIECAFGRLKAKQIDLKLENILYIIYMYFLLRIFAK